jgi:hypothetical protein
MGVMAFRACGFKSNQGVDQRLTRACLAVTFTGKVFNPFTNQTDPAFVESRRRELEVR